jgi:hypothetical protein
MCNKKESVENNNQQLRPKAPSHSEFLGIKPLNTNKTNMAERENEI